MNEHIKSQFPILTINELRPLLRNDEKVFSYAIKATDVKGETFTLYENKGLNLSGYIGQKMECLLEIVKGEFEYADEEGKKPENTTTFKYQWLKRPYEFFPELVKMSDDLQNANTKEEGSMQELFETRATELFQHWGLNGLGMDIYQAKPLLSSEYGFFLLNEYEFEEEIEELELDEEVYIKIEELYLRGIRPCNDYKNSEQEQLFTQAIQKEDAKAPKQMEEPKQKKKGKFGFFLE